MAEPKLLVRAIIEMIGNPKEHLIETLTSYVEKLKTEKDITVIKEKYEEPVQKEDNIFATFVELEIHFTTLSKLIWFCYDYMPATVEVIDPEEAVFKAHDITSFFNEILTKLHSLDMLYKKYKVENEILKKNTVILIRNFIKTELRQGTKTIQDLEEALGVPRAQIEFFIDKLMEEGKIKREGNLYSILENQETA